MEVGGGGGGRGEERTRGGIGSELWFVKVKHFKMKSQKS